MFLYELAVELGHRSTDVAAAAEDLGLGPLSPATMLDAAQVDALRRHFGQLAPTQPAVAPPPLPAAPAAAPLAFGAPPPPPAVLPPPPGLGTEAGGPVAPPSWGPPPAPPPGAVVHAPPPPPPPAAPISGLGPPPPGAVPAFLPPSDPPVAPPPPPPGPPAADAPTPSGPGGLSRGQLTALGVVAVLVLGLFGFMVVNTGPDHARERALAKQGESATTVTFQASTTTTEATTSTAPTTTGPDRYAVRDRTAFCEATRTVNAFELRTMAEGVEQNFDGLKQITSSDRAGWADAVATLRTSGPIALQPDLDTYLTAYNAMFDALAESSSPAEFAQRFDVDELRQTLAGPANRINSQFRSTCG